MATTYDKTVGGTAELNVTEAGYYFTLRRKYNTDSDADGNVVSGDTLSLLNIPADTFVERIAIIVETIEDGTLTVDVGDGSGAAGFLDDANMESLDTKITTLALTEATPNTVTGYTNGKLYTAADTIDMLFNNAADTVKFEIVALCIRLKKADAQNNPVGST